jgi:Na+-driven multidrug efflux pump
MRQNDFENTPMLKLVMSLAIPSMIAQLVNILYSIVDRMFVGQIEEVGCIDS